MFPLSSVLPCVSLKFVNTFLGVLYFQSLNANIDRDVLPPYIKINFLNPSTLGWSLVAPGCRKMYMLPYPVPTQTPEED